MSELRNIVLESVVLFTLYWFFACPIETLLHEMGHALVALLVKPGKVTILIGTRDVEMARIRLQFGRLALGFRPGFWMLGGCVFSETRSDSVQKRVWILLGGPLVSLVCLVVFGVLAFYGLLVWQLFAWAALWGLLLSAIPMRYPRWFGPWGGAPSDGLRVLWLLQGSGSK